MTRTTRHRWILTLPKPHPWFAVSCPPPWACASSARTWRARRGGRSTGWRAPSSAWVHPTSAPPPSTGGHPSVSTFAWMARGFGNRLVSPFFSFFFVYIYIYIFFFGTHISIHNETTFASKPALYPSVYPALCTTSHHRRLEVLRAHTTPGAQTAPRRSHDASAVANTRTIMHTACNFGCSLGDGVEDVKKLRMLNLLRPNYRSAGTSHSASFVYVYVWLVDHEVPGPQSRTSHSRSVHSLDVGIRGGGA